MSQEVQIWQVAGRKRRNFESPQQMWEVALKYFKWCDDNPLWVAEQVKQKGKGTVLTDSNGDQTYIPPEDIVEIPKKRAYTKTGFCVFAGVASNYLRLMGYEDRDAGGLRDNEGWMECLDMILSVIYTQNVEGAAAGQFNPYIVQSVLGLTQKIEEKKEITEVKQVFQIGDSQFVLE